MLLTKLYSGLSSTSTFFHMTLHHSFDSAIFHENISNVLPESQTIPVKTIHTHYNNSSTADYNWILTY